MDRLDKQKQLQQRIYKERCLVAHFKALYKKHAVEVDRLLMEQHQTQLTKLEAKLAKD